MEYSAKELTANWREILVQIRFLVCSLLLSVFPTLVHASESMVDPSDFFHSMIQSVDGNVYGAEESVAFGSVSGNGGYDVSVPVRFPEPRGDLRLPFDIRYTGGNRVGNVGVGFVAETWHIRESISVAGRKPLITEGNNFGSAKRIQLFMGGESHLMNPTGRPHEYQAMVAGRMLRLVSTDHGFLLNDTDGRQYEFKSLIDTEPDIFYHLTKVTDRTGENSIEFTHSPDTHSYCALDEERPKHPDLLLSQIAYSFADDCPKYVLDFEYGPWGWDGNQGPSCQTSSGEQQAVLSVDARGGFMQARMRILKSLSVNVSTENQCVLPMGSADATSVLKTYQFAYRPDRDTHQPRLTFVDVRGRDSEEIRPVAVYSYGSTELDGELVFGAQADIPVPADLPGNNIGIGFSTENSNDEEFVTHQVLADMTGDGLADLAYFNGSDWILQSNLIGTSTNTLNSPDRISDLNLGGSQLTMQDGSKIDGPAGPLYVNFNSWSQLIDFNGDGRLDRISALQDNSDVWSVELNLPGAQGAQSISWSHYEFDVTRIRFELLAAGLIEPAANLSLSRSTSDIADDDRLIHGQWKLEDVNGDGLPDFIFNAEPLHDQLADEDCSIFDQVFDDNGELVETSEVQNCTAWARFKPADNNNIRVYYNVSRGGLLEFSDRSTVLVVPQPGGGVCGVEAWFETQDSRTQICGFSDINGDGFADYLQSGNYVLEDEGGDQETIWVWFGNGRPGDFAPGDFHLPGPMAGIRGTRPPGCDGAYTTQQTSGLIDLTGDGIPDYVQQRQVSGDVDQKVWGLRVGMGVGYAKEIPMKVPATFQMKSDVHYCDDNQTQSISGLLDINGDKRPEFVLGASTQNEQGDVDTFYKVYEIVGGLQGKAGAPNSGRLIAVDNGYAGRTNIAWQSAKRDPNTRHQIPYPEMVVVETHSIGLRGLADPINATQYAYGDANLFYDALMSRFSFRGYGRKVTLRTHRGSPQERRMGSAKIFDRITPNSNAGLVGYRGYALVGMLRDEFRLSGVMPEDPRDLLGLDLTNNQMVQGAIHTRYGVSSKADYVPQPGDECDAVASPYDATLSSPDPLLCARFGFVFPAISTVWEGSLLPPGDAAIIKQNRICEINDYGQTTWEWRLNDVAPNRADDDVCQLTEYSVNDVGGANRMLSEISSSSTNACAATGSSVSIAPTYTRFCKTLGVGPAVSGVGYLYDGLPSGQIQKGLRTANIRQRYNPQTGALLDEVISSTQQHDEFGNITTVIKEREDGVVRETNTQFGPFGISPVLISEASSDVTAPISTSAGFDPVLMKPTLVKDANGFQKHYHYDSFGRLSSSGFSFTADQQERLLSEISYEDDPNDPTGRRIVRKDYDWLAPLGGIIVETPLPIEKTTWFDEFGRNRFTENHLGADYQDETLISGYLQFDELGRRSFEADPYLLGDNPVLSYGTSYHYYPDGKLECSIRGNGPQSLSWVSVPSDERFATCTRFKYDQRQLLIQTFGPNELTPNHNESGSFDEEVKSANDWLLRASRWTNGQRVEHSSYSYDRLGQQIGVARFVTPQLSTGAVANWSFVVDSLGQLLSVEQPDVATRFIEYDSFGQVIRESWGDNATPPVPVLETRYAYDGFGRYQSILMSVDGIVDDTSITKFQWDADTGNPAHVNPDNLLGRLAAVHDSLGSTYFGYDVFGGLSSTSRTLDDINGRFQIDRRNYVSGKLSALLFNVQDGANTQAEVVNYGYDSAGRMQIATVDSGAGNKMIFEAKIDPFGHYRQIWLGNGTVETATFAQGGRQVLEQRSLSSASRSDVIQFADYDGEDKLGRRTHTGVTGTSAPWIRQTTYAYDSMERLTQTHRTELSLAASPNISNEVFNYDAIGNVTSIEDTNSSGAGGLQLDYSGVDPDRICGIQEANVSTSPGCNVHYDIMGNIVEFPDGSGVRTFDYDAKGRLTRAQKGQNSLSIAYDGFGEISRLSVDDAFNSVQRRSIKIDPLLEAVDRGAGWVFDRKIAGPEGRTIVTLRGFGDQETQIYSHPGFGGNELFSDQNGKVAQEIEYKSFGGILSDNGAPGTIGYSEYQWSEAETLRSLGIALLGARVYDLQTGRFLQRDPLIISRPAGLSNPYAFAFNDPINFADPTGLDPNLVDNEMVFEESEVDFYYVNRNHIYRSQIDSLDGQIEAVGDKIIDLKSSRYESDSPSTGDRVLGGVGFVLSLLGAEASCVSVAGCGLGVSAASVSAGASLELALSPKPKGAIALERIRDKIDFFQHVKSRLSASRNAINAKIRPEVRPLVEEVPVVRPLVDEMPIVTPLIE
ncbi:RHS repeat domain-containing protein [Neptunomonas antarctica]|uniref:RHS repeat-associated core domain-containing protein n=1 Tax=Neptunomonas antarctica TaxID=619304 RepID=A0A1N7LIS1_9GAMM|nr:RHS repeat-associated core domain-containing protein [Neptunomonas antarctica]SIS73651.1 RHS repeat-associated core domain-containing protein [Neptunomonas antarctica]